MMSEYSEALEDLEKTFNSLMSNHSNPKIFGLPIVNFNKIRKALKKAEVYDYMIIALETCLSDLNDMNSPSVDIVKKALQKHKEIEG